MRYIKILLVLLFFFGCADKMQLPSSTKIYGEKVEIKCKDRDFKVVFFGNNISDQWSNIPMEKSGNYWVISFTNPHKPVQYKFFIDKILWEIDPTNQVKVKVPSPYIGYNSLIEFN